MAETLSPWTTLESVRSCEVLQVLGMTIVASKLGFDPTLMWLVMTYLFDYPTGKRVAFAHASIRAALDWGAKLASVR